MASSSNGKGGQAFDSFYQELKEVTEHFIFLNEEFNQSINWKGGKTG